MTNPSIKYSLVVTRGSKKNYHPLSEKLRTLGIIGAELSPPDVLDSLKGFWEALNWDPMMPRDV